ncbi:MAG TPA: molybdate ABC transporter substrate-binding protein [Candidatus Dormibacteraeota bacterium]|nr:molybdate ABC transporter substrate-binding protein [Candidatus Dormibacteraeota bacterium]
MINRALLAGGVLILAACVSGSGQSPPTSITVYAAASLELPFDRIATPLMSTYHVAAVFDFAGTQTLTAQLMQGAQADVFASADSMHMNSLQDAGLLAGQPKVFARNRLEVAVEKGNPKGIRSLADLARPGVVVVLADPSVPAGRYAQQSLSKAGVTVHPASLEPQVTGVLSKVALGEADAGIVYVSDVVTSGKVDGIAIPDSQNVIADYPIAVLANAHDKAAAQEFITFLLSTEGQSILKQTGFEAA